MVPEKVEQNPDRTRVLQKSHEVWESEEASQKWLNSSVPALGGSKPIELIDTPEGRRWVSEVLEKIETGDFS